MDESKESENISDFVWEDKILKTEPQITFEKLVTVVAIRLAWDEFYSIAERSTKIAKAKWIKEGRINFGEPEPSVDNTIKNYLYSGTEPDEKTKMLAEIFLRLCGEMKDPEDIEGLPEWRRHLSDKTVDWRKIYPKIDKVILSYVKYLSYDRHFLEKNQNLIIELQKLKDSYKDMAKKTILKHLKKPLTSLDIFQERIGMIGLPSILLYNLSFIWTHLLVCLLLIIQCIVVFNKRVRISKNLYLMAVSGISTTVIVLITSIIFIVKGSSTIYNTNHYVHIAMLWYTISIGIAIVSNPITSNELSVGILIISILVLICWLLQTRIGFRYVSIYLIPNYLISKLYNNGFYRQEIEERYKHTWTEAAKKAS